MNINDTVLIVDSFDKVGDYRKGKIIQINSDTIKCRTDHPEDQMYYKAFIFPISAEGEIRKIQQVRQKLKEELQNSMGLVYELSNRIKRGELK